MRRHSPQGSNHRVTPDANITATCVRVRTASPRTSDIIPMTLSRGLRCKQPVEPGRRLLTVDCGFITAILANYLKVTRRFGCRGEQKCRSGACDHGPIIRREEELGELEVSSAEQQLTAFLTSKNIHVDADNIEACHSFPTKSNNMPAVILKFG
uniref:Uncharacterized protein n=1 Tax=Knipowitschia caucasica TaxID=637954 RepID=A0AAV2L8K3_KNICA